MTSRREFITLSSAAVAGFGLPAAAQSDRPVALIVGFPPGGSGDTVARALAQSLQGSYASSVMVDNRPGAGGRIALQYVKSAQANGNFLIQVPISTMAIYPHVYRNLPYDPLKDFVPVGRVAKFQFALCVGPAVPESVRTLADFATWCRANPGRASFGSQGEGTMGHFAGFMIAQAAVFNMAHVAYKGSAPALQDVLGGHIPASIQIQSEAIPYVKDGRLRALVATGRSRIPQLPLVPTLAELGHSGMAAEEYFAVFAPAGTPQDVIQRLSQAIERAMDTPQLREKLEALGFEPAAADARALARLLKEDLERWGPIVRATGFQAS